MFCCMLCPVQMKVPMRMALLLQGLEASDSDAASKVGNGDISAMDSTELQQSPPETLEAITGADAASCIGVNTFSCIAKLRPTKAFAHEDRAEAARAGPLLSFNSVSAACLQTAVKALQASWQPCCCSSLHSSSGGPPWSRSRQARAPLSSSLSPAMIYTAAGQQR